jgi:hypothetical protein
MTSSRSDEFEDVDEDDATDALEVSECGCTVLLRTMLVEDADFAPGLTGWSIISRRPMSVIRTHRTIASAQPTCLIRGQSVNQGLGVRGFRSSLSLISVCGSSSGGYDRALVG